MDRFFVECEEYARQYEQYYLQNDNHNERAIEQPKKVEDDISKAMFDGESSRYVSSEL